MSRRKPDSVDYCISLRELTLLPALDETVIDTCLEIAERILGIVHEDVLHKATVLKRLRILEASLWKSLEDPVRFRGHGAHSSSSCESLAGYHGVELPMGYTVHAFRIVPGLQKNERNCASIVTYVRTTCNRKGDEAQVIRTRDLRATLALVDKLVGVSDLARLVLEYLFPGSVIKYSLDPLLYNRVLVVRKEHHVCARDGCCQVLFPYRYMKRIFTVFNLNVTKSTSERKIIGSSCSTAYVGRRLRYISLLLLELRGNHSLQTACASDALLSVAKSEILAVMNLMSAFRISMCCGTKQESLAVLAKIRACLQRPHNDQESASITMQLSQSKKRPAKRRKVTVRCGSYNLT
jgi:hypothetical protein